VNQSNNLVVPVTFTQQQQAGQRRKEMVRQFNCSSSGSSSFDDATATSVSEYTDDRMGYNKSNKNRSGQASSALFKGAEDLLNTFFEAGTISCGIPSFQKRGGNGTGSEFDDGVQLDWRKDPYHSMSDWTLIVRDGTNRQQPQMYHIHKSVVSYGNRKSGFLLNVFEQEILEGSSGRGGRGRGSGGTTEVALPQRASSCVPQLLDYIYFDKLDLNSQCAPSMRYLANTFDVRDLYALVSSFIQSDISEATITTYIREAEAVKDKELLGFGMTLAANKFDLLPNDSLLELPPHIFQQLTSNPQLNCPSSERLSQRVATYARGRSEEINDEVFYFMTHAQILPKICSTEAMWFLTFAASKFGNVLVDDSMGGYEGTLKRRCIVAAAKEWKTLLVGSVKEQVRRRVDGGGETNNSIMGSDVQRRRLFVDGENLSAGDKEKTYMSLPTDIRVELLEEALLAAASEEKFTNVALSASNLSKDNAVHLRSSGSFAERRGDVGKRGKKKGRREKGLQV